MAVTDDNVTHLRDCLSSLVSDRRLCEVVVVVVGTARGTTAGVADATATGWRVRILRYDGATVAKAWDEGTRKATGDHLMMCEAGDRFAPGALTTLLDAVSDGAEVAGADLSGLGRTVIADLVVNRSLWRRVGLSVPDAPFGEWWVAARLLLAARSPAQATRLRAAPRRGTGVPFGTMVRAAPWVQQWSRAVRDVTARVESDAERHRVVGWLLADEVQTYLMDAERCTPQEWEGLRSAVEALLELAGPDVLSVVGVESRVRVWLATHSQREVLEQLNVDRWLEDGQFPTHVADGRVYADLPLPAELVPSSVLVVAEHETPLVVEIQALRWLDEHRLRIDLLVFLRRVHEHGHTSATSVRLVGPEGGSTPLPVASGEAPAANLVAADPYADHSGALRTVEVDTHRLLAPGRPGDRWQLVVEHVVAGVARGGRPTGSLVGTVTSDRPAGPDAPHDLTVGVVQAADRRWDLEVQEVEPSGEPRGWSVTRASLEGGRLVVEGTTGGPAQGTATIQLRGPVAGDPSPVETARGSFRCELALEHDEWQLGRRPLPSGSYRLHLLCDDKDQGALAAGATLALDGARWQRSEDHRARAGRGDDGAALTVLAAPLADDEVGSSAQQELRRWYATDEHRLDPAAVYLQAYTGATATDSPLAIHHALLRLRPELKLYWGAADRSTILPDGAVPVLLRSREWYAALARCAHIVTNIDMDRWFVKRPGQRLLQTFHGYPAKTMGISAWEAKNFTPRRVERLLRRTSGTWDLLLTPTPAMDVHYREQYLYEGEILSAGYPRDDVLVGPDAERIRQRTRQRLGIGERQRVLLYAPTWRDDLATNFRAAAMATGFDTDQAAQELGEDWVVLLRGHRFHRRRHRPGARVVDVSGYPEINDLTLAADAAVLDYSSLRFDFALTGRPMVFLVPDLDRYTGGVRGFLHDFRASAPGPLVTTTDEVVAELRDLPQLSRRWSESIREFNETFNSLQDGDAANRTVEAFFGADS